MIGLGLGLIISAGISALGSGISAAFGPGESAEEKLLKEQRKRWLQASENIAKRKLYAGVFGTLAPGSMQKTRMAEAKGRIKENIAKFEEQRKQLGGI